MTQIKDKYIIIIVLFFYTLLGLIHSNNQGFWHDEIYTLTFLKGISAYTFEGNTLSEYTDELPVYYCKQILDTDNFIQNFPRQIIHEGHPPLYFILLKGWSNIFGYSELALRSFSLVSGLFSIMVLFGLIKRYFKNRNAIWIILLILFNPFLFYYFTEARMYALAFFLATLCFKYWLKFKEQKEWKSYDSLWFTLSALALLFTHYYGLFFLLSLGFYDILKNGFTFRLISYSIPIIIFSPWIFIIRLQTEIHNIHWTDESLSFVNSSMGFGKGLISLFFSPMSDSQNYENLFAIIVGIIIIGYISSKWKYRLQNILVFVVYFSLIYTFDLILNNHTIIVSRYYIFILIIFYWGIVKAIDNAPQKIGLSFIIIYFILGGLAIYKIYSRSLAPKQMFKELANYIDAKHNAENTLIVVEPGGPMIWGLALYLNKDFSIISAENFKSIHTTKKVIFIDEMLGVKYNENLLNTEDQNKLNFVPFVGLFLYE